MAKLNIPERYRIGVSKIRRLDERSVREIRKALDQTGEISPKGDNGIEVPRDPDSVAISAVRSATSVNADEFAQIVSGGFGIRDDPARPARDPALYGADVRL